MTLYKISNETPVEGRSGRAKAGMRTGDLAQGKRILHMGTCCWL